MIRRTMRSIASVLRCVARPAWAPLGAAYRRAAARAPGWAAWKTGVQKALFTYLVGAAGVVAVALATIQIEDVVNGWTARRDVPVLLWLCAVLGIWAGFVGWRRYLDRAAGTLYHVRALAATMHNWHEEAQQNAEKRFLRLQDVTRPLDMRAVSGVIDVRQDVAWIEEKLSDRFATDDQATGFTIAPDMLAPVAFGLGYRLTLPRPTHFLDFASKESPEFDWAIHEPNPVEGFVRPDLIPSRGTGSAGIHVHAHFSDQVHDPSLSKGCVPLGVDVRATLEVGVPGPDGGLVPAAVSTARDVGAVHPGAAVEAWARAVRCAIHASQGEPVILTGRAPKAVSLAAGYMFAPSHWRPRQARSTGPVCGLPAPHSAACHAPWRHIVFMNFNLYARPPAAQWEPVWLLAEQRDPRELIASLGVSP